MKKLQFDKIFLGLCTFQIEEYLDATIWRVFSAEFALCIHTIWAGKLEVAFAIWRVFRLLLKFGGKFKILDFKAIFPP